MNDPITLLRERLPGLLPIGRKAPPPDPGTPDPLQMLTAELLLVAGIGTLTDAMRDGRRSSTDPYASESGPRRKLSRLRPVDWGPAVLGGAAALAHAVHAFVPGERARLATRTFDVAVVGVGLLSLADGLAGARQGGRPPSPGPLTLASAALLGVLVDRTKARHRAERHRLEKRSRIVERLVPRRSPRLDRIVVHV